MASRRTAASSGKPAGRSRSTSRASGTSRGMSLAHPTMNSSALGSRSLLRNGDGSMELNNCFSSPTCTSISEHLGGIGSPDDCLSAPEVFVIACPLTVGEMRNRRLRLMRSYLSTRLVTIQLITAIDERERNPGESNHEWVRCDAREEVEQ